MYNAEKYVGECLDSILAQTFQSFEVIVVDDCSTDCSVNVVESYMSKFNGRLKIGKTEKNTGNPGEPGNIGVAMSRGEYLLILDNDDTITPDALEKLYNVAKDFDADVVTCEKYYAIPEKYWNDVDFIKQLKPSSYQYNRFVNEPTLIPFDIANRFADGCNGLFLWPLWTKLIRRSVLTDNGISFAESIAQDFIATLCLMFTAKKFVCVPYVINYSRRRAGSVSNMIDPHLQKLKTYLSSLNEGFKHMDKFLSRHEFFQENYDLKCKVLKDVFFRIFNGYIKPIYDKVPAHKREEVLREEFIASDNIALTAFLFNAFWDVQNFIPNNSFKPFITARVDIELNPESGKEIVENFPVSVPAGAYITPPARTRQNGIIYIIHSNYKGHMEIVAKATVDGKIGIRIRSMFIRDAKDKTKIIPYQIDYTKLIVNGEIIFDNIKTCYYHSVEVKKDNEVKIQVSWLPHMSDM